MTLRPRLRWVQVAFQRAADRGEIGADVDVLWETDAFVGALFMRTMGRHGVRPPGPDGRRTLVERTVRALTSTRQKDGAACDSYSRR